MSAHDAEGVTAAHEAGKAKYETKPTAQALLDTFKSFPGATLRLVFRHIDTAPASPEVTSAAHALVDVLWKVHTGSDHCVV